MQFLVFMIYIFGINAGILVQLRSLWCLVPAIFAGYVLYLLSKYYGIFDE